MFGGRPMTAGDFEDMLTGVTEFQFGIHEVQGRAVSA
jgi:hypothetical protein